MSAEPLPTTLLHDRMPDWWRPLGLDLDGQRLLDGARASSGCGEALSLDNIVDAVAFAHGDVVSGVRIIGTVRSAARSADGAFAGDVGDAEPPAMVAAALCDQLAVDPDSDLSTVASLLVLCASYGGHRPAIDGMALAEYAARQLDYRVGVLAARGDVGPPRPRRPSWSGTRSPRSPRRGRSRSARRSARRCPLTPRSSSSWPPGSTSCPRAPRPSTRCCARRCASRRWLLESWCETADLPWSEVPAEARALIAALELAARRTPAPRRSAPRACSPAC